MLNHNQVVQIKWSAFRVISINIVLTFMAKLFIFMSTIYISLSISNNPNVGKFDPLLDSLMILLALFGAILLRMFRFL